MMPKSSGPYLLSVNDGTNIFGAYSWFALRIVSSGYMVVNRRLQTRCHEQVRHLNTRPDLVFWSLVPFIEELALVHSEVLTTFGIWRQNRGCLGDANSGHI